MGYYDIQKELEEIRTEHGGVLRASDVVEYASDPSTALHTRFEWDDNEAAKRYRLAQARSLIKIAVVVEAKTDNKVRAFVSLSTDRNNGGGYRAMVDVLNDEVMRDTLMEDARNELEHFHKKYISLKAATEMRGVFKEIEKVTKTKKMLVAQEDAMAQA